MCRRDLIVHPREWEYHHPEVVSLRQQKVSEEGTEERMAYKTCFGGL